jgi:hypothetical protein
VIEGALIAAAGHACQSRSAVCESASGPIARSRS